MKHEIKESIVVLLVEEYKTNNKIWSVYRKTIYKDIPTYELIVNSYGAFDDKEIVPFRITLYKGKLTDIIHKEVFLE